MAYRHDEDLQFLAHCTNEELNDLVYCLTHDKYNKMRRAEALSTYMSIKRIGFE
ncbi:DUF3944 domain-containing protein [Providencia manganoxydans]